MKWEGEGNKYKKKNYLKIKRLIFIFPQNDILLNIWQPEASVLITFETDDDGVNWIREETQEPRVVSFEVINNCTRHEIR